MSTRERWIVYPLLALALGTSMRAKFFPLDVHQIQCEELIVTHRDGGPSVTLVPGGLELAGANGKTVLMMGSTPEGGFIKTAGKKPRGLLIGQTKIPEVFVAVIDSKTDNIVAVPHWLPRELTVPAPHSKEPPVNEPQRQPPPESQPKPNALSDGAAPPCVEKGTGTFYSEDFVK